MRIAVGLEYDGTKYHGWQKQNSQVTIQEQVETALSRIADAGVTVVCAGRTDAGVHALEQVVHFDADVMREDRGWVMGANTQLPDDIRVLWAKRISPSFHARYAANARFYQYIIRNRAVRSALLPTQETWCYRPLDAALMQKAANFLVGEHDFSSFRGQHCQSNSPSRKMYQIHLSRHADLIFIDFIANSFLQHMVRNIAGVLIKIGQGQRPPDWAMEVLSARDRNAADITASPRGLYLVGIHYPEHYGLAKHPMFDRLPKDVSRFDQTVSKGNQPAT